MSAQTKFQLIAAWVLNNQQVLKIAVFVFVLALVAVTLLAPGVVTLADAIPIIGGHAVKIVQ